MIWTHLAALLLGVALCGGLWYWAARKHKAALQKAADEASTLDIGKEFKAALAKVGIRV